ncbi:hypothetical protein J4E93_007654 [Alternaria ventricosa]|uniref:uncharacterized protein n=1 Tax=Alternaria ventricosa TaxID=1187951 RepID=UPI0020C39764|nr:uncharacterized protein J4E93_007654 [Alternaria ventricosa]KAI4641557.1 hypothetical protein J4E93_007654 [Alternaria ventricosa]
MGTFTQLPAELQIQIFDYLHAADVKSARAVSRTFRNNATPALFRSIVACARYQALGAFQNVSLHSIYSGYVREIIFDGTLYDGHLAKDHRNYSRAEEASGKFQSGSFYAMRTRWKRYQELHKEQESMKEDGVLLQSCARGLENMQNISSIVYSPYQHTIPMEVKTLRDLLPRGARPGALTDNRTTDLDHPFRQLIGAVFLSDYTGIRQLTIEAPREDLPRTEFSLKMFSFPDTNDLSAGRHLFRNLVKLDMSLSILNIPRQTTHPLTEIDSPERQLENLAKVLEAAQELRHLSFGIKKWRYLNELNWNGGTILEGKSIVDIIGLGATWPKLRSLKLEGVYARERDLCELIDRHKDTLRTLTFATTTLQAGLWIEVVNEVVFNASMITTFVLDHVDEDRDGNLMSTNGSLAGYEGRLIVTEGGDREFVRSNPIPGL